ncbi:MAG TPA: tetratricopeptide repeat protein [Candidatus Angelobacter sp.]|nr:tetratricopeptide repeat protein [Candidatus Angelobacter sp.]
MMGPVRIWALLLAASLASSAFPPEEHEKGIIVEQVAGNFEGAQAGLREGDVIQRWSRGDAHGEIESPFDLAQLEIEQEPRGPVTLEGLRGAEKQTWILGPNNWRIKARPYLTPKLLEIYLEGTKLAKSGRPTKAAEQWKTAAKQVGDTDPDWLATWLIFHAAESLTDPRQSKESDGSYQEAVQRAIKTKPAIRAQIFRARGIQCEQRGDLANAGIHFGESLQESQKTSLSANLMVADSLNSLGRIAGRRGDGAHAERYFRKALDIREKLAPGSLAVAGTLNNLGVLARTRGDLAKADGYLRQALEIREKLVPDSLEIALNLNNLGRVAEDRGELQEAESLHQRALELRTRLNPGSLDVAGSLGNLGNVAEQRGELDKAERYQLEAWEIRKKLAPESPDAAESFNAFGILASNRGDLIAAEKYNLQALDIRKRKLLPNSIDLAASLFNLAQVAWLRGDLATAEDYHRRSLAIKENQAPGSVNIARSFTALGMLAEERGHLVSAEQYLRRALRINQEKAPAGLPLAASFNHLGKIALRQNRLRKAENCLAQALLIEQKQSPTGLDIAETYTLLGSVFRERGSLDEAEVFYRKALAIREKLTPGSIHQAQSLALLAGIMRLKHQPDSAAQMFDQALNALENQTARLGGAEDLRSGYRATYAGYYEDYIDLLMAEKQPERAFEVFERSRGRTLLEMLTETRMDIRKGVDPLLIERERVLREKLTASTNFQVRLLNGNHTEAQAATTRKEIEELLTEYQQVKGQIRTSSPSYAALTQPRPLTVREVQQRLLDQETVLLEYSLGEERSYVWAVTSTSVEAHALPGRARIESLAARLYKLLAGLDHSKSDHEGSQAELNYAATTVSRMILAPVARRLKGKRLLIVSDGALQYIPFAVLPAPNTANLSRSQPVPLVVEHEIISSPSATVSALVREDTAARNKAPKAVAVLADPVFDAQDPRVTGARATLTQARTQPISGQRGWDLSPSQSAASTMGWNHLARLPFSQREATAILEVTPPGQGLRALGFQASRATATSAEMAQYRTVHFATHGLLNNQHPEFSGLVLSLVDEHGDPQNGFLLLQDIYNLNLPAELVVLSACETALGKEVRGEGLIGLTRGFMYAGAARVLASLWNVDDVATAELMARFYKAMEQDRMTPPAALRQAQIQMWKQKRWHTPYFWGEFQMQGAW